MGETAVVVAPGAGVWVGELLSGPRLQSARAECVVVLPADPDLVRGGATGYVQRYWGPGWEWDRMVGTPGCPLIMQVVPDRPHLYWAAEVGPSPRLQGTVRLTVAPAEHATAVLGLAASSDAVQLERLEQRPAQPIVVRGRLRVSLTKEGYVGLGLWAAAQGLRVRWLAVTQSRQEVAWA